MINTRKVKARMVELGYKQPDIANELGINLATFNGKLNGKTKLYLDEAVRLCKILQISASESAEYFGVGLSL